MTLSDIAKKFKIARTTVSVCLSGQEEKYKIRRELAEEIRAYAREHGYVPNRAASRLRSKGNSPLGIVFTYENGMAKFLKSIRRIIEYLTKKNREYLLMGMEKSHIGATMTTLRSMGVEDVIVLGKVREPQPTDPDDVLNRKFHADWKIAWKLLEDGMKLHIADYDFPLPPECAHKNIFRAGHDRLKLVQYILEKMTESNLGPIAFGHWFEAETQLIPALLEDENMILPLSFDSDPFLEGYNLTEKVLELVKTKKLRSVFIGNDYIAGGLIKGLLEKGIRIPEDIAVIGFGNYDAAPYFAKSLTSIGASSENTALEMIKAICGDREPFPENTVISYSIYERESLVFNKSV